MASAAPRILEARTRAATAKRAIAAASVVGFLAVFVLARAAHPGHTTASQPASSTGTPATGESSDDSSGGLGFGSGSIAPSQNVAPSVQTHTS
jgi:hypothetical protein